MLIVEHTSKTGEVSKLEINVGDTLTVTVSDERTRERTRAAVKEFCFAASCKGVVKTAHERESEGATQ
jgi:hypothetical protein